MTPFEKLRKAKRLPYAVAYILFVALGLAVFFALPHQDRQVWLFVMFGGWLALRHAYGRLYPPEASKDDTRPEP